MPLNQSRNTTVTVSSNSLCSHCVCVCGHVSVQRDGQRSWSKLTWRQKRPTSQPESAALALDTVRMWHMLVRFWGNILPPSSWSKYKKNVTCIVKRFLPLPGTFVLLPLHLLRLLVLSDPLHTPTDTVIILFISPFEAVAYPAYAKAGNNTGRPQRTRKLLVVIVSLNNVNVLFTWKHRWLQSHAISAFLKIVFFFPAAEFGVPISMLVTDR